MSWSSALGRHSLTQQHPAPLFAFPESPKLEPRQINDVNWQTSGWWAASPSLNKLPAGDIFRPAFRRGVRWDCVRRALCLPLPSLPRRGRRRRASLTAPRAQLTLDLFGVVLGTENDAVLKWMMFSLSTRRTGGWSSTPLLSLLPLFPVFPSALCAHPPPHPHGSPLFFLFCISLSPSVSPHPVSSTSCSVRLSLNWCSFVCLFVFCRACRTIIFFLKSRWSSECPQLAGINHVLKCPEWKQNEHDERFSFFKKGFSFCIILSF